MHSVKKLLQADRLFKTMRVAAIACLFYLPAGAHAQSPKSADLPVLQIAAITNPDPSRWAIEIIKRRKLDEKYGFDLRYTLKPVSVAYTDFLNGRDPVCLCLTIATGARFLIEGADVSLVWTYSSYTKAYIVTEQADIKAPADLAGRTLPGSTGSGSWVFLQYFLAKHQGVDLGKVNIPSIVQSAQATNLLAGRIDAMVVFEDQKVQLEALAPGRFRFIPILDREKWRAETGIDYLPMFLLGIRTGWYDEPGNKNLLRAFHAAYSEAIAYLIEKPKEAANLIGEKDAGAPLSFVVGYLTQNPQAGAPTLTRDYKNTVRKLTQDILPPTGLIKRALTDEELDRFVLDFQPQSAISGSSLAIQKPVGVGN